MKLVVDNTRESESFKLEFGDVLICDCGAMLTFVFDPTEKEYNYCMIDLEKRHIIEKYKSLDDVVDIVDGEKVIDDTYVVLDIITDEHLTN